MPSVSDWMFGSPDQLQKVPTGSKEQMQFGGQDLIKWLQGMMQQGGGFDLANQYDQGLLGGGQDAFNQFSAPYMQQFQEQILPQIAERFAGGGALSSSGFGQSIGGAASGLQANLAQMFEQLKGQAAQRQQGQFQNLSQVGLNYQPYAYNQKQGSGGFFAPLLAGIGAGIGGPLGAGIGQGIGSGVSSLFKNSNNSGID
jgi:hypothetical protein